MKSGAQDTGREAKRDHPAPARSSRAPLEPEGADKALLEAGAMGNQVFQQQAAAEPEAVLERLGEGEPLATEARRRMEAAFGEDFSGVRMHKDATAAQLASQQGARAFALGEHVAFASGEFQPGTLVGDAVLAHELAHVMQQREGGAESAKDEASGSVAALEDDADVVAGNAAQSLWSGGAVTPVDKPRRGSGLRLARCNGDSKPDLKTKKSVTVGTTKLEGSSRDPAKDVEYANKKVYNQANLEVKASHNPDLDETKSKAALGTDLVLDEYTTVSKPTQEEKNLFAINPVPGGVATYYVKDLTTNRAEAFPPYAGVGVVAAALGNKSSDSTFAHELGHILLNGSLDGHDQPDAANIMFAPESATPRAKLTDAQIKRVRDSSLVK